MLVFLYPLYASNQLNGGLFQTTLTSSLLAVFLFVISGISYFEVVASAKLAIERKRALIRRGDSLFVLSLMMSTAMPALILFALPGLLVIAVIATLLWVLSGGFIIQQVRKPRGG